MNEQNTVQPSIDEAIAATTSSESVANQTQTIATESKPFLDNWSTSIGMFLLGLLLSAAVNRGLDLFSGSSASDFALIGSSIVSLAFLVLVFVYSLVIYPSLFTDKPKLQSSKTGSFLNSFVGGLIFGAIWCSALTKKKKGISQYVLVVLVSIVFILTLLLNLGVFSSSSVPGTTTTTPTHTTSQTTTTQNNSSSYEKGTVGDFLQNPADYCTASGAISAIEAGKTGVWESMPEPIKRITFGHVIGSNTSMMWTDGPEPFNDYRLSEEEAYQIAIVAIAQMFEDPDIGVDVVQQLFGNERLNMYGPINFSLDGRHFYITVQYSDDNPNERLCQVLIGGGEKE